MNSILSIAMLSGGALLLWSLAHRAFAWFFEARIVRSRVEMSPTDGAYCPKATVLMSLRGRDPYLEQNLKGLLAQTYPEYEIIVVIDSHRDAAWSVAQDIKSQYDEADLLRLIELKKPLATCSLKCSSLIQATEHIDPLCEAIVFIDSDVVPHASWLSEAVQPLANPNVGVVTGSQWFAPSNSDTGTLVRCLWNSAAIVASAINANPWAGTCAMRFGDLKNSGLIEKWKTSVVDDGPIKPAFERLGLRVVFEPRLIMVNRDQCTSAYAGRYVTRMLTWSRIYEKTFVNTVVHAILMLSLMMTSLTVFALSLFTQNWVAVIVMGASMVFSNLIMYSGFQSVRRAVQQAVCASGRKLEPITLRKAIRMLILLPVCQFAHVLWTIKAIFVRQANWRNITYRLHRQQRVEMVAYQPYAIDLDITAQAKASL